MDDVDTEPAPGTLLCEHQCGFPVGPVADIPPGALCQRFIDLFGCCLRGRRADAAMAAAQVVKVLRWVLQVVLSHDPPDGGQSFDAAHQQIDGKKSQEEEVPPGAVHMGQLEGFKKLRSRLPIAGDVKLGRLSLFDDGTDDRGRCQYD